MPKFADSDPTVLPAEIRFAGFRINPMTSEQVVEAIAGAVENEQRLIMANINFHGMALAYESHGMRGVLADAQTLVMIDSMPLLFMARLAGHRLSRKQRTTSLEFYDDMFERGLKQGWSFGFVGGTPDVLAAGLEVLRQRHPGLQIDGHHGYFDIDDTGPDSVQTHLVAWLQQRSHDVVIVGMGMPRQEDWICRVRNLVPTRVFLPAGGYLDYQVGVQRRAPRWLGQMGLEWAFRLVLSPRRLGYRYLGEPFLLAKRLLLSPYVKRKDG